MRDIKKCRACGEGELRPHTDHAPLHYNGVSTTVLLHSSICSYCGSELTDAAEALANKRAVIAAKKSIDGLYTGSQVLEIRTKLDITQSEAAWIFGGGPVAFSKYEKDDVTQSKAMNTLLQLVNEVPAAAAWLINKLPSPRRHQEYLVSLTVAPVVIYETEVSSAITNHFREYFHNWIVKTHARNARKSLNELLSIESTEITVTNNRPIVLASAGGAEIVH